MDENKNFDAPEQNEEITETAEEITEEITEEIAEDAAEEIEEAAEETEDAEADSAETWATALDNAQNGEAAVEEPEQIKKGSKIGVIIAVIAAVLVIAAAAFTSTIENNKYNKMGYVNISGKTIQDLLDDQGGMELSEFLKMYDLPEDMPADTTEAAAYYNIPARKIAEMYGMDFATLKETLHMPDTVTEDSTWGEAEGEVALGDYVGADNIEEFKKNYGLGDDVTADTKWKEIRKVVDEKQKADREAAEKEAKDAADNDVEDVEDEAEAEVEEETEAEDKE